MSAVENVRAFLVEHGIDEADIDRAERDGTLHLLVLDCVVFPDRPRYTGAEVAELAGLDVADVKLFWRALGFADVADDEVFFTEADLEAVTTLSGLLVLRVADSNVALQLARVIGSSMARIAEAELSASPVAAKGVESAERAELVALTADATFPSIARLLEYSWRRHLQAAARRTTLWASHTDITGAGRPLTIGFADMVGFTALSQQLSEEALATIVARFEAAAYDTVTSLGGRVVKMIGDEVMFVVDEVADAARIGIELADVYADDEMLSDVRVGIACGSVLTQDGDYYGPVVNLAHRIVKIANPGSVLVSDTAADALRGNDEFQLRALRPRFLKDLGRVPLWLLVRDGDDDAAAMTSNRIRRRTRRPGVLALLSDTHRERVERSKGRHPAGPD